MTQEERIQQLEQRMDRWSEEEHGKTEHLKAALTQAAKQALVDFRFKKC